jgi:alpha-mannosidase
LGVVERTAGHVDDTNWMHAAPTTWPVQGWVAAGGLAVMAPGLSEGELLPDGTIALTLLRAVGWLSRYGLATRPEPAGPGVPTPGAQCPGLLTARLALFPAAANTPGRARAAELGLRGVIAGPTPLVPDGTPLLTVEPGTVAVSAVKPAEDGNGLIVRVLNPTSRWVDVMLRFGRPLAAAQAVRLDEDPSGDEVRQDGATAVHFRLRGQGTRSIRVRFA